MTFAESFALEVVYIHNTTNNENDDALNPGLARWAKFTHPPIKDNPAWGLKFSSGGFASLAPLGLARATETPTFRHRQGFAIA